MSSQLKHLSRAELEREFMALQAQLAQWEGEMKVAPSTQKIEDFCLPRDRKKYTPAVVAKRVRREEVKTVAAERVRAAIVGALARAPAPVEERKWETPQ